MWKVEDFTDDRLSKENNWKSAKTKLLDFLNEENPEVVHFSVYGQYEDNYKLLYKEREPID